jgi:phospholipid transport system substrate-binding protein
MLTLSFMPPLTAAAANEPDPKAEIARAEAFVTDLSVQAIDLLRYAENDLEREEGFTELLAEKANMRRIARFTLGQYVRKVSKEDFATFQDLLDQMIVKVYDNRLKDYSDERVIVGKARNKKRNFIVDSKIEFANGRDPISIDWWLVREKDGRFTLFDVRVLGVWMAQEQRASFSSVLQNNKGDINALLDHLRKQISGSVAAGEADS